MGVKDWKMVGMGEKLFGKLFTLNQNPFWGIKVNICGETNGMYFDFCGGSNKQISVF